MRIPEYQSVEALNRSWKYQLGKRTPGRPPKRTAEENSRILSDAQQLYEVLVAELIRQRLASVIREKGKIRPEWTLQVRKDAAVMVLNTMANDPRTFRPEDILYVAQSVFSSSASTVNTVQSADALVDGVDRDIGVQQMFLRGLAQGMKDLPDDPETKSYVDQLSQLSQSKSYWDESQYETWKSPPSTRPVERELLTEYATPAKVIGGGSSGTDAASADSPLPSFDLRFLLQETKPKKPAPLVVRTSAKDYNQEKIAYNRIQKDARAQSRQAKESRQAKLAKERGVGAPPESQLQQIAEIPELMDDDTDPVSTTPVRQAQLPARDTPGGIRTLRSANNQTNIYGSNPLTGSPANADWSNLRNMYDEILQNVYGDPKALDGLQKQYQAQAASVWSYMDWHTRALVVQELFGHNQAQRMQRAPGIYAAIQREIAQLRADQRWVYDWDALQRAGYMNFVKEPLQVSRYRLPLLPKRAINKLVLDDYEFLTYAVQQAGWLRNNDQWETSGMESVRNRAQTEVQQTMFRIMMHWRAGWVQLQPYKDEKMDLAVFLGSARERVANHYGAKPNLLTSQDPETLNTVKALIQKQWSLEFPRENPQAWLPLVSVSERARKEPSTWFPYVPFQPTDEYIVYESPVKDSVDTGPNTAQEVLAELEGDDGNDSDGSTGTTAGGAQWAESNDILLLREARQQVEAQFAELQRRERELQEAFETQVETRVAQERGHLYAQAQEWMQQQTSKTDAERAQMRAVMESQMRAQQSQIDEYKDALQQAMESSTRMNERRQQLEEQMQRVSGTAQNQIQQSLANLSRISSEKEIQVDEFRRALQVTEEARQKLAERLQLLEAQQATGATPMVAAGAGAPGGGGDPNQRNNGAPVSSGAGASPVIAGFTPLGPVTLNPTTGNVSLLPGDSSFSPKLPANERVPKSTKPRRSQNEEELKKIKPNPFNLEATRGLRNQDPRTAPQEPAQSVSQPAPAPTQSTTNSQATSTLLSQFRPGSGRFPIVQGPTPTSTDPTQDSLLDNLLYLQRFETPPAGQMVAEVAEDVLYPGKARRDRIFQPMRDALKAIRVTSDGYREYAARAVDRGFLPMRANHLPPSFLF